MDHLKNYINIYKQLLAMSDSFESDRENFGLVQLGIALAETRRIIQEVKKESNQECDPCQNDSQEDDEDDVCPACFKEEMINLLKDLKNELLKGS